MIADPAKPGIERMLACLMGDLEMLSLALGPSFAKKLLQAAITDLEAEEAHWAKVMERAGEWGLHPLLSEKVFQDE